MKKLILLFTILISVSLVNGQTADKKWGLGLHLGTIQYQGDRGTEFFKYKSAHPAGMLSLSRYLKSNLDVEGNVSGGMLDYTWATSDSTNASFSGQLINVELLFKYKFNNGKLLKEDARIAPYLFLGIGDAIYKNEKIFPTGENISFNFPMGGGLKLNLTERAAIDLRLTYHYTLTEFYDGYVQPNSQWNDQFLTSAIGLVFNIDKKDADKDGIRDKLDLCANTPLKVAVDLTGCPKDKDKDGVPDYLDKCPDLKGTASAQGCPDSDGDAIQDKDDACPTIAGLASLNGCPDADGDGIQDDKDKCPSIAGLASFNGCPDKDGDGITDSEDKCPNEKGSIAMKGCPDSDNDGVADAEDACPTVAGTLANKGCPEVNEAVKKVLADALAGVQFESGKDVIKKSSYGILDNVVKVMIDNPSYKLDINGHTDSQGDDAKNLGLSQKRSDAVKLYLSKKGIAESRLKATGFGETQPVDTNDTAKGRAKNRRVEFKINF